MVTRARLTVLLVLAVTFCNAATVWANSAPVYVESYPAFNIAPMSDAPIHVDQEELTFRIDRASDEAMVTATYILTNKSGDTVRVPMIFPFVTQWYRDSHGVRYHSIPKQAQ